MPRGADLEFFCLLETRLGRWCWLSSDLTASSPLAGSMVMILTRVNSKDAPTTNEEIVAPSVQNKQQAEESAFGPWMVVERRQRKLVIRQDNPGKAANGMVRTAALIPRVKPRGKGKVSATPKPSKPINLRKSPSINFAEFPALSRIQSKASSSHYSSLDQSKHTAVVMNENLNPNVGNLPSDSIPLLFPDCTSPQGEPPDKHAPPSQLPAPRILVDTSQQYTQNVDANDETDTARAVAMLE
ncbi:hypothetical protein V6N13_117607 [Hibiscus sabdariffa]